MTGVPTRFMNPGELDVLCALARMVDARKVIEFGCNIGRTAMILCREVPTIKQYIGVDVLPGYIPAKEVQRHEVPATPGSLMNDDKRFRLILSKNGSFDLTPDHLGNNVDMLFIDGDHGEDALIHDTGLALSIVRNGGIIVWHDYHDLGTVDVRDFLHRQFELMPTIRHVEGTWIAYVEVRR